MGFESKILEQDERANEQYLALALSLARASFFLLRARSFCLAIISRLRDPIEPPILPTVSAGVKNEDWERAAAGAKF